MARRTAHRLSANDKLAEPTLQPKPNAETKPKNSARPRRARIKPEERYREFVAKAVELFAEVGFDAGTRELAQRLNVTQPLLYRYFPSKEKLIDAVYEEIYVARWKPSWTDIISRRDLSLADRLQIFYEDYTDTIFTSEWLRIYMFAGLRRVDINARYVSGLETEILQPIAREMRFEMGLPIDEAIKPEEIELLWSLHGGIYYYGVRKVVYGFECPIGKALMIKNAIAAFLDGAQHVMQTFENQSARSV